MTEPTPNSLARLKAAKAGEKRFDGKPCIRCGETTRHTSNGACVRCTLERANAGHDKFRELLRQAEDGK